MNSEERPQILNKPHPSALVIDTYKEQLEELDEVENPERVAEKFERRATEREHEYNEDSGVWVHFPWRNTSVHLLKKDEFRKVRLSRNQDLITKEEQEALLKKNIGIAGLNVGHPGAICLALEGISEEMKITDFDTLSLSNLNRFRAGVCELGVNKATLTARQIYEIDPFYQLDVYDKGLSPENIDAFLDGLDLLIEEMDNMPLKLKIREKAKERKIPVLMVTGNEAGLIIDVERYDQEPDLPLLNGHMSEEVKKRVFAIKPGESKFEELVQLLQDFMEGEKNLNTKLLASFKKVGMTIAGIPQLSEASFIRGAMLCYFSRMILTGEMPSGRYSYHPSSLMS